MLQEDCSNSYWIYIRDAISVKRKLYIVPVIVGRKDKYEKVEKRECQYGWIDWEK